MIGGVAPAFQASSVPASFLSLRTSCLYLLGGLRVSHLPDCTSPSLLPGTEALGSHPAHLPRCWATYSCSSESCSSAIAARTSSCARSRSSSAWRGEGLSCEAGQSVRRGPEPGLACYLGATGEVLELLVDLGPGCSFLAPARREGGTGLRASIGPGVDQSPCSSWGT